MSRNKNPERTAVSRRGGAADLVLRAEAGVGDVGGEVRVVHGAERQAVRPAAAEVGEVDVLRSTGNIMLFKKNNGN